MEAKDLKIGKILEKGDNFERDAIHCAVIQVEAGEQLYVGMHVSYRDGKVFSETRGAPVGIIDPFLIADVIKKGDKVWLFLYPQSIHSMRHNWYHPAFETKQNTDLHAKSNAISILKECAETCSVSYNTLLSALENYYNNHEWYHMGQNEDYKNLSEYMIEQMWDAYKVVSGNDIITKENRYITTPFSCSC